LSLTLETQYLKNTLTTFQCAKRNKTRQHLKRQLSDHTADINQSFHGGLGTESHRFPL